MSNSISKSIKKAKLDDSFIEFIEEFANETDRAAVVLGAAQLDMPLYQIIQLHLFPSNGSKDELLDGDSPLGTFSSKISLVFRLGLIDIYLVRVLHLIRKIRNSFAHEVGGCTLASGAHKDRVRELVAIFQSYEEFESLKNNISKNWSSDGPSRDFRVVLAIVSVRLERVFANTEQLNQNFCTSLIPIAWHKEKEGEE